LESCGGGQRGGDEDRLEHVESLLIDTRE
jgi:hypothetical protein